MSIGPFQDAEFNEAYWETKNKTVGFQVIIDDDKCNKCFKQSLSGVTYLCKKHYTEIETIVMNTACIWGQSHKEQE